MEQKAQVEKYAQQKAEEEAILRATKKARENQEKWTNKVSAEDMARVQERVRIRRNALMSEKLNTLGL